MPSRSKDIFSTTVSIEEVKAQETFPDALRKYLEFRGWYVMQFAEAIGYCNKHVYDLLKGKTNLTLPAAYEFEKVTGVSGLFWIEKFYNTFIKGGH